MSSFTVPIISIFPGEVHLCPSDIALGCTTLWEAELDQEMETVPTVM
jgi:hypothetical protein